MKRRDVRFKIWLVNVLYFILVISGQCHSSAQCGAIIQVLLCKCVPSYQVLVVTATLSAANKRTIIMIRICVGSKWLKIGKCPPWLTASSLAGCRDPKITL